MRPEDSLKRLTICVSAASVSSSLLATSIKLISRSAKHDQSIMTGSDLAELEGR